MAQAPRGNDLGKPATVTGGGAGPLAMVTCAFVAREKLRDQRADIKHSLVDPVQLLHMRIEGVDCPHAYVLTGIITRSLKGPRFRRDERHGVVTHPVEPPRCRFGAVVEAGGASQSLSPRRSVLPWEHRTPLPHHLGAVGLLDRPSPIGIGICFVTGHG